MEIAKEFGFMLEVIEIEPYKLFSDETGLDWANKLQALTDWSFHNINNAVPLITFAGQEITAPEDLERILQAG